jgi:REP element-mobilizing transposase RayT
MRYDANQHHRRSMRLANYDYRSPGAYFVTICVHAGECLLGQVVDGRLQLSDWGQIAWDCWQAIPTHFPHVKLDTFVVMPNHVHGIIVITEPAIGPHVGAQHPGADVGAQHVVGAQLVAGAQHAEPLLLHAPQRRTNVQPGSLGAIVRSFKAAVTRRINQLRNMPGAPFWQRNYWERVVRSEASLKQIREYIENNPARWAEDQLHPEAGSSPFRSGKP